jgi:hypothetical protein
MAVTLRHSFESGQSSGTTVTTGNSGTGGNAFDSVTINTTCTCTYDSSAYRGSLGCAVSSGGTSGQGAVNWTTAIGTALPHGYGRLLVNASSFSVAFPFMRIRGGASVQVTRLAFTTAGKVEIRNSSNSVAGTSTTVLNTGQWYLIRWDVTVGSSATGIVYIHTDPTSATPTETLTVNAVNFNTNNINEHNAGIGASTANVPTFHFDDIVLTDQGVPGPPIQSINISETVTAADSIARTLVASRAAAESLGAADTIARTMIAARAAAESATVADAVARAVVTSRSAAESVAASDAVARATVMTRAGNETLAAGDAIASGLLLPRSVAESLTAGDAATRSVTASRSISDAVTATDSATAATLASRTAGETMALVDAAGRLLLLGRAVPESLTATDSVNANLVVPTGAPGSLVSALSAASLVSVAAGAGLRSTTGGVGRVSSG